MTQRVTEMLVRSAKGWARRPNASLRARIRRSEHHAVSRLQCMDPMRGLERADLLHHVLDLARLDVLDAPADAAGELRELLAEHRRAEMAADARELAFVVGERG